MALAAAEVEDSGGREGCRRGWTIVERGVRPLGVVLRAPLFDDNLRFAQRIEDLAVQTFVAQLAVETFAVAILPGAAGLDEERRRSHSAQPFTQFPGDKFGPIIRT